MFVSFAVLIEITWTVNAIFQFIKLSLIPDYKDNMYYFYLLTVRGLKTTVYYVKKEVPTSYKQK